MEEFIMWMCDSSDEDELIEIPPLPLPDLYEDDNEQTALILMDQALRIAEKTKHVKNENYIENTVTNYINVDFIMHFRLQRDLVYNLIDKFNLSAIYTSIENPAGLSKMNAEKFILCYLWFVGHEAASYRDVADRFDIAISSLHHIITVVTDFILSIKHIIIKYPTEEEKAETAHYFETVKGFPGVIGAIDGCHIRIDRPFEDAESYINRNKYFSIHLQATVNQHMKFIDVFIGYPGSVHDARVFENSTLGDDLAELCGENYFLLGDSAYSCKKQLMVPYKDRGHITRAQKKYNQKLSSCRVVVEQAFGKMKQRFRQLYHLKLRNIKRMVKVIHACCVLHNIADINDIENFEIAVDDQQPDIAAENLIIHLDGGFVYLEDGAPRRDQLCALFSRN